MELESPEAGRGYLLPDPSVGATYGMATPSLGQGAFAKTLSGTVRVEALSESELVVVLDLSARMSRIDVAGEFDERVRGRFRIDRKPDASGIPG